MRRPTVAVTGATGFIGSRVLRRLAETDYRIRAARRPDSPRWHVEDIDCEWRPLELERPETVESFVQGATGVIHCAGYKPRRARRWREAKRIGVRRFRTLLEACDDRDVGRLVYVSAASTLVGRDESHDGGDQSDREAFDETTRYVPGSTANALFEAKAAMEAELYRYVAGGLDVVVAVPTTVLGPGNVDSQAGRWVRAITEGWLPALPEGGTVNVVDVRDVADGIVAALERGRTGRRYALAGRNLDVGRLFEEVARIGEVPVPNRRVSIETVHSMADLVERGLEGLGFREAPPLLLAADLMRRGAAISSERAEGELNFRNRSLDATIRDMLAWMRRVGFLSWSGRGEGPGLSRFGVGGADPD